MDAIQKAANFLTQCDEMLNRLESNPQELFNSFEGWFGKVTDRASFLVFYKNFMEACPYKEEIEGNNTEEEALKVWGVIDVNHNDVLDPEECKTLVSTTIKKGMQITRHHFGIPEKSE
jgi:hypothetical protein